MRPVLALLLPLVLVAGCSSSDTGASSSPAASASSGPTASSTPLTGVRVLPADPSHTHVKTLVDYPDSPPLGGDHNIRWLACDVYDAPVPDEFAVHSMEHGGVWITYRPGLPAADVATLAALANSNQEFVLVSPYEGLATPVQASTWGRSLTADAATDPRLAQFVQQFAGGGQGGEEGAPCRTNGVTPREARGLLPGA